MGWTEYSPNMKLSDMIQSENKKLSDNRQLSSDPLTISAPPIQSAIPSPIQASNNSFLPGNSLSTNLTTPLATPTSFVLADTPAWSPVPIEPTMWDSVSSGFGSITGAIGTAASTSGTAIVNSLSNTGSALSALGGSLLSGDVNKVGSAASNLVSNLAATVVSPLTGLSKILGNSSPQSQQLQANLSPNTNKSASDANSKFKSLSTAQIKNGTGKTQLFSIGSPCRFNNNVDPQGRISAYLRTKMQVIDLIPCDYKFNFDAMQESTTKKNAAFGGIHSISYDERIEEYNRMCTFHGLQRKNNKTGDDVQWGGVRIFSTDDSTMSENISVSYKQSALQKYADTVSSDFLSGPRDLVRSIIGTSSLNSFVDSSKSAASKALNIAATKTGANKAVENFLATISNVGLDLVGKGYRTNFPKIWDNSSYNSNLSATIKLVSPYGHPEAIKEFIIRPFLHLLLLVAPHTTNGCTYGDNIPLTIKAYGMEYLAIGAISSIDFTRGGGSTSFNLYKQPLTIDIRLSFQPLCDGFAAFAPTKTITGEQLSKVASAEADLFAKPELTDPTLANKFSNTTFLFKTPSSILKSLQPVQILNDPTIFQTYGTYTPIPLQTPGFAAFTPMMPSTKGLAGLVNKANSILDITGGVMTSLTSGTVTGVLSGISSAVYGAAKASSGILSNTATKNLIDASKVIGITGTSVTAASKLQFVGGMVQNLFSVPR
jgi:hypothetical protein